jgi:hypothetical protein
MNEQLRPINLALFDVSCIALDASRKVEQMPDDVVSHEAVLRVLERLLVVMDGIAAAVDVLDAEWVGEPP